MKLLALKELINCSQTLIDQIWDLKELEDSNNQIPLK